MLIALLTYWKSQTRKEKLFITVIFLALIYGSYVNVQKVYYKQQYYKELEGKYNRIKDSLGSINKQTTETIDKGVKNAIKTKSRTKKINDKLKQDEASIDSTDISTDRRNKFLAGYDNY